MKEAHTRPETSKKQPQDRGHHEPPCPPGGGEALSVWPAASQLPQRGSQDADLTASALASPFGGGGIRGADDGEGKRRLVRCGGQEFLDTSGRRSMAEGSDLDAAAAIPPETPRYYG
ncbi:hypothetical protein D7V91_13025 [bacterium 1xD42-67]|nr:hypothetical protein D7V91_13025 [bacterium 1xD42-67]